MSWKVKKIGVIGPGIVGMPMAALLANAGIKIGSSEPARVIIVQRNSKTSGWKVSAINNGISVIGGIEPALDQIVRASVEAGCLAATHDYEELSDADVILVCVQTDKKGFEPDYGPLMEALTNLANALQKKPEEKIPLIVFESTLAPSTMLTVIVDHFKKFGLVEGKDILLGNSPNRVMPGRLVDRIHQSDKLVGGLRSITVSRIYRLYSEIVTAGKLYKTNSLTAEIVKTLENAYRDVRIAYSSEVARYCDENDINYFKVRDEVNQILNQVDRASYDANAVPTGGLLIPTIGVGGHCLPKDGILLWWRKIEASQETSQSLILKSREINNDSPRISLHFMETTFGPVKGRKVALLGAAYRFNSEDTRNSPSLFLAGILQDKGCQIRMHDPFVKIDDQNLIKFGMNDRFTNNLDSALADAEYAIVCTAHQFYIDNLKILAEAGTIRGLFDGCNLFTTEVMNRLPYPTAGIGKGKVDPDDSLIQAVVDQFHAVEHGIASEVLGLIEFLNRNFVKDEFNKAHFQKVKALAATCSTGCNITNPVFSENIQWSGKFRSELASIATGVPQNVTHA